ncbi:MAG: glucosamine--fructose-6-phosphate aminotransferase [Gammaproteobacteria bacterium]|nr:glucosamine--fructose-6-phosphate aminotransferase [Gammaproteobacteria bacterium]
MPEFHNALRAWSTDAFSRQLKLEIEALCTGALPLAQATTQGGKIDDSNITATVLSFTAQENIIQAKAGIFFTEIIGGCNCDDDPVSETVYCEMLFNINMVTAETTMIVIPS